MGSSPVIRIRRQVFIVLNMNTCFIFHINQETEGSHCKTCGIVLVHQEIVLPSGHNCNKTDIIKEATSKEDGIIVTSNLILDNAYSAVFTLGDTSYDVVEVLAYDSFVL